MRSTAIGLTLVFLLAVSSAPAATLYKWTDEKGVVHISEKPPPQGVQAEKMVFGDKEPAQPAPGQQNFDVPEGNRTPGLRPGQQQVLMGTGFFVNGNGYILTNHHLVQGCSRVFARLDNIPIPLTLVKENGQDDLALLKAEVRSPVSIPFRQGQEVNAGENIVVLGFPYHGLLANDVNVSSGIVSALAGIRNDKRFLQIAAPVQPGNSGGPLLDQSGNLVGVVVGKLDALKLAKITGDIPQNVNFAIKSRVAEAFLDLCGVSYQKSPSDKPLTLAAVVQQARGATVLLQCYR